MTDSFHTTRWSLVSRAGRDDEGANQALDDLCRAYWSPVYAYLRQSGHKEADAQDLTQSFFTAMLAKQDFAKADAGRGRFRSWLLTCLQNYVANELRRARAAKRGGGTPVFSLSADDWQDAERTAALPTDRRSPEWHFERAFARSLLTRAENRLIEEYTLAGKQERCRALLPSAKAESAPPYSELATRLGTTEGSVKVFVHHLRQRFAAALRREVQEVLVDSDTDDVEAEILWVRRFFAEGNDATCGT